MELLIAIGLFCCALAYKMNEKDEIEERDNKKGYCEIKDKSLFV